MVRSGPIPRFGIDLSTVTSAVGLGTVKRFPNGAQRQSALSFAVCTCQDYLNGYYTPYGHVADEDVDFLLHLGDFIYESAAGQYKGLGSPELPGRTLGLPSGKELAWTLEDFRYLHRTYRSDRQLQRALEQHTLIATWDDHAVANNRFWDHDHEAPVLPDHPRGNTSSIARRITAAGIRAWVEYLPTRVGYDPDADHLHESFRLYRRIQFGDLLDLLVTDERFYRSRPPDWTDVRLADAKIGLRQGWDSDRTMLGETQREWFLDRIRTGEVQWTGWANEVLAMPLRIGVGSAAVYPKFDAWDGYTAKRALVFQSLAAVQNTITLTGDMHSYLAGYQTNAATDQSGGRITDPDDPADPVGVELMTPAVTSVNIAEAIGIDGPFVGPITKPLVSGGIKRMNPHFRLFESHHWGYSVVEFTQDACNYTAYVVDKTPGSSSGVKRRLAGLSVPSGCPEIQRAE